MAMTRVPYDPTETDTTASDLTVMRGNTGSGSGEAMATPRVLKQRFVLEEKLGAGGMGTVYRAKDLRKVEARDRDPYLAVKVLNNDFRAHPDAFIALQREAAKSQALAHPNIVSIFDFDKDGEIPYMTMELLKGKELGALLRDYPSGLPDAMAWPVIEHLCAGLKRAHDSGITHADFKPGNVFVTDHDGAKILDFGIARAVQVNTRFGDDDTVFDPSKLAALTPAYASREMLLGEAPEPTDDIYSLAVVVYLILTGRHPYQRVRADEAARDGLRPERIKRLTRGQWWVLERALSFEAAQRPQSLDEVIAGLVKGPVLKPWMTAVLLVVAVGIGIGLSVGPATEEREVVARDTLMDAQVSRIDELLEVPVLDDAWHERVRQELDRLVQVDDGGSALQETRSRVLAVYLARLDSAPPFDTAVELLRGADQVADGGRFHAGYASLERQVLEELDGLLAAESFDRSWIDAVELQLLRFSRVFPESTLYAELEQRVGDAYLDVIGQLARQGELGLAGELFALTAPRVFDHQEIAQLNRRLDRMQVEVERLRSEEVEDAAAESFAADLDAATGFVCQRLDGADIQAAQESLLAVHGTNGAAVRGGIAERVAACVVLLAETDTVRAAALRQTGLDRLGDQPALAQLRLDPCSMRYLIGNGNSPGGGVCADTLQRASGPLAGPELVVVPNGDARFGITRTELRNMDLAAYCEASGCSLGVDPNMPATGLSLAQARGFAEWLSAASGYQYRFATLLEWQHAAADAADPNCRGDDAVPGESGLRPADQGDANRFGLVNALGNAQEWVVDAGQVRVVGGSYADAVSECGSGAVDHDGRADGLTAIRLVREIR